MSTITLDIEATDLLQESSIDYQQSPYQLKDSFFVHCIVIEEHESKDIIAFYDGDTYVLDGRPYIEKGKLGYTYTLQHYNPIQYIHKPMSEFKEYVKSGKIKRVIAHNGINYDLMVCKLFYDLDYTVEPDTWAGMPVIIEDTMVTSKTLNPDRFGGHSLDNLGKKVGLNKLSFRPQVPIVDRFKEFAADMLYYCIRDVQVNTRVYYLLEKEKGNWKWEDALSLEKSVAEIITRQEHRGFKFDKNLAEMNIQQLDLFMEERRLKVTPLLPKKAATKGFMKDFTPPVRQFLQNGKASSYLTKFAEKLGATIEEEEGLARFFVFNGKSHSLPLPLEPLVTEQDADIDDSTHIKDWLVSLGWQPSEYKEKDLTYKQVKGVGKVKRTQEEYEKAVDNYIKQTLTCSFKQDRLEFLDTTEKALKGFLLSKDISKTVKVITNPSFTVGQDKEICANLEKFKKQFPYVKDVVEYLTYKHRRNSILGGGMEWDDEEEAEKGYMAFVREDGRIATPADTCGCATSRFKHRVVANIPRSSSLFGKEMRALFGVDKQFYQIGYDFDSLEAREEAHYCWTFEEGGDKEYCNSLLLEKPNDVHSQMAKKISNIIQKEFTRSPAKSVKYAATYGATAPKIAKTIGADIRTGETVFNAFWEAALPLKKLKERLLRYWKEVGNKQFILGVDGRKVPTRSQHAILNSLFQSAGVICAKRAMVIHDRLLKEHNLHIDFFKEDWKNKYFASQLIAYHDEAQLEVSRSLVKFKVFPYTDSEDEDESKEIHKEMSQKVALVKKDLESEGILWSDVSHTKTHYYLAYSLAGELAVKAVQLAGEYYKLKVQLTSGYVVGRNWAECH